MALSESDRRRYTRHLMVPELGEPGQERLSGTTVRLAPGADPFVAEVATRYLAASGVGIAQTGCCVLLPSSAHVGARAERTELHAAEAALAGTMAALDVVRGVLGWEARRRLGADGKAGPR